MATLPQRLSGPVIALLLAPAIAHADEPHAEPQQLSTPTQEGASPPPQPPRRGGVVVGLAAGLGVASIVGYPNDLRKEGYASWYTATGVRPSALGELWIGNAFSDWFVFGLGFTGSPLFATGSDKARSFGGLFHIEAFPLYRLGGHLRDLGIMLDAGIGTATVTDAMSNKVVDGSAAALLGGGVFYEVVRTWKIGQGPFLMGNYVWSDTALRPAIYAGWRMSLYTKP